MMEASLTRAEARIVSDASTVRTGVIRFVRVQKDAECY